MKKIWIINQYNMPPEYGHLNRHYNFGKYLKRLGYEPFVFVGSFLHNTKLQMIKDKSICKKYKNCEYPYFFVKTCDYSKNKFKRVYAMFEFYRNLFKATKDMGKPDVVLGSSAHPLAAIAAINLSKKYGCQSIVEVRDLWPESFVSYNIINKSNPILKALYAGEKWIYKNADQLIFTMEGGRDYIIDKGWDKDNGGPIDLQKVHHINNGVDLEVFEYNKKHYILEDEDLESDDIYKLVYVGSLRKANDSVWRLIEVAESFKEKGYSDIKLLMYGDGGEREKIESYCKEKKLDNVIIKGYVDKKYIPNILSQCDLNVLNCSSWSVLKYGGSQNKLFDYLASGHPIISGENSKYSIVKKYNCGISKEFENLEALEKAILDIKALDSNSKKNMNLNILKVANKYDYTCLTKKLIQIIESSDVLNEKENIDFSSTY